MALTEKEMRDMIQSETSTDKIFEFMVLINKAKSIYDTLSDKEKDECEDLAALIDTDKDGTASKNVD